jgi:hypothetical protein
VSLHNLDRNGTPSLTADPDITRAAKYMIEKHGEQAWPAAVSRATHLHVRGQEGASVLWRQVAGEIALLQHVEREQAGRK